MSGFIKKLFGTLIQKPWEKEQMAIDSLHDGKTFNISTQKSAVIIIFGIATVLFSLVFTGYLYTLPPEQDTRYLLKPNLLWINTLILFFVTYFFGKVTKDLEKKITTKIKKNLIKNLKKTNNKISVLEIGAHGGYNLLSFKNKNAQVLGVDYSTEGIEIGKKYGITLTKGDSGIVKGKLV